MLTTKEMIEEVAQRILAAIGKPFSLHGLKSWI